MAERIVSPGVFTRENDLSFLPQGIGEIGAAFIGPFKEGPAFVPTIVTSGQDFQDKFGTVDGTYYTEIAVRNYLREAGTATIVRVGGVGGYEQVVPLGIVASGSAGETLIGTLFNTSKGFQEIGFLGTTVTHDSDGRFVIEYLSGSAGANDVSSSIFPSDPNDLTDVFGQSPFGARSAYTYNYFPTATDSFIGDVDDVTALELPSQDFTYDVQSAETPWITSQLISDTRYDLFRFYTLGDGTNYNTKYKISLSNVKAAGEDGSTDYSTFTVTIRSFGDTDKRKSVVETYNNVNLDPTSPNYIARRIGDRHIRINPTTGKIIESGNFANISRLVRVKVAREGSFPISAAPFGHRAYNNPIATEVGDETLIPAVIYTTGSVANTAGSPVFFSGFDFETPRVSRDNIQYLVPIPENAEGQTGNNTDFGFDANGLTFEMTKSLSDDMVKRQFSVAFQGGFDGLNPIVPKALADDEEWGAANTQGFDCSTPTAPGSVAYKRAINAVSNADEFDINMVVTPGLVRRLHTQIVDDTIEMVESREDAFFIADFSDVDDTIGQVTAQANEVDSNYAATYFPWLKTVDNNTNRLISVPPSVLLPAVYAANDAVSAEWFAPAGLNRGGIIGAVSVLDRLTHTERDTLYENKVNPIAAFPGQGIVAFGQKTLQDRSSALDRINVRRLLIGVKKFIASTSRFLVFEQNTATTRNRFINTVTPFLESIQQRQGLFAFRVVMDESNNTPDVIDRNILAGQLFLQPTKTAEFIIIDFNVLPTGATFSA